MRASGAKEFAVTWPVLENDGLPLQTKVTGLSATTTYETGGDEQCFLSLTENGAAPAREKPVLGSYGWLRPVRVAAADGMSRCFIYPRSAGDPGAETVRESFHLTEDGFQSALGRVQGALYVGRTSAGGVGSSIDLTGDHHPDAVFDVPCAFILQLRKGRITAVEADRETKVRIRGKVFQLARYTPLRAAE